MGRSVCPLPSMIDHPPPGLQSHPDHPEGENKWEEEEERCSRSSRWGGFGNAIEKEITIIIVSILYF